MPPINSRESQYLATVFLFGIRTHHFLRNAPIMMVSAVALAAPDDAQRDILQLVWPLLGVAGDAPASYLTLGALWHILVYLLQSSSLHICVENCSLFQLFEGGGDKMGWGERDDIQSK